MEKEKANHIKRSWNSSYIVGIAKIDRQHEQLFDIYDEAMYLSDTKKEHQSEGIKALLLKLEKHIEEYSSIAPELLAHSNQEEVNRYVSRYQDFIRKIDELGHAYSYRNAFLLRDMQDYLKKWIISNIIQARFIYRQINSNK